MSTRSRDSKGYRRLAAEILRRAAEDLYDAGVETRAWGIQFTPTPQRRQAVEDAIHTANRVLTTDNCVTALVSDIYDLDVAQERAQRIFCGELDPRRHTGHRGRVAGTTFYRMGHAWPGRSS